jgi:hypothetical protein
MGSARKPSVLFIYFSYTQQTLKVSEAMADVLRGRGGYQGAKPFRQQISASGPPSLTRTSASTICWSTGTGSPAGRRWQVPMPVT